MSATPSKVGTIFLVGAGPGDPALITVRGVECLREAEVVLHDELVAERILEYISATTERICLKELAEHHTERSAKAMEIAIARAKAGKTVVRLKGGDPTIFGRCFEETAQLRQEGVPYEIVPGVTAACAASAYAEVPLTHRELSSTLVFTTGHECVNKREEAVDWSALARIRGTVAIYMGVKRLEVVAEKLMQHGMAADCPAAVVQWASSTKQKEIRGRLGTIAQLAQEAGLQAPAMVLLGRAVGLQPPQSWFERLPLHGQTVLVTRPRGQAEGMARTLERLGADVLHCPVLEIGPPPDSSQVQKAMKDLGQYHWLVFTSSNGVRAFMSQLRQAGKDLRALGHLQLAAIGPYTAAALETYHLQADVVPGQFRSEDLAEVLRPRVHGQRVLLARANRGRDVLPEQLAKVAEVTELAVYTQRDIAVFPPVVTQFLATNRTAYVTLTSANIARQFLALLSDEVKRRIGYSLFLVSISPVTSAAVQEMGYTVAGQATEYTGDGVVAALADLVPPIEQVTSAIL